MPQFYTRIYRGKSFVHPYFENDVEKCAKKKISASL